MKKTKKVMCSGLAFLDKEDMEKLHKYALKGWIFKEFKGLSYVLYKDEAQDLIFDYDIAKIDDNDIDEYNQIFINAGWTPIKHNYKHNIHFFSAPAGTPAMHTDKQLFADNFKSMAKWSLVTFIISLTVLTYGIIFKWTSPEAGILKEIILMLSAGLAGGSGMSFIGCYLRTKGKKLFGKN